MFEKTKAFCDEYLDIGIPGFDLLLYKDGQEFFRYMNGYSDLENKIPINGSERRWIYSCSKPMTVTAAMQLWERGKFQLDDQLSDYLPAFKDMTVQTENGIVKAQNPIRIRNLFTMTAGFSYNYNSPGLMALREHTPNPTTRQASDALAEDPLLFEPGDQYRYSLCHDVLGALIEVWSGQSFESYMKENIFDRLGMENSTYHLPEEELPTMSALYRFDKETNTVSRLPDAGHRLGVNFVSGGGGCVSTTSDYMKFAEALRTGERLLKRETLKLMTSDHLTEWQKRTFTLKTMNYGLGMWNCKPDRMRHDIGWGGAAGAMLAVDESRGLSMVYMQHMLSSPNQKLRGKMLSIFLMELEGIEDDIPVEVPQNYNLTY